MDKVELRFNSITYRHTHAGAYTLMLAEVGGDRRLPIFIGAAEAQAIAVKVENIKPARPLTHDLFKDLCDTTGIHVKEVIITDLVEAIFYAKLVVEQNGDQAEVDARSSDAIALALRFECPIFTYEHILSAAGLKVEDNEEEASTEGTKGLPGEKPATALSIDELRTKLEEAIDDEDYERASMLRDELKKREGTN